MKKLLIAASFVISGCATNSGADIADAQRIYEASLDRLPTPKTEQQHNAACKSLRVEIARIQGLNESVGSRGFSPAQVANLRASGYRNIALLQSKMAEFNCGP